MNGYLKVLQVCKNYKKVEANKNISLEFPQGKLSALLGPDGAGKSTLLHIVAGVLEPDSGDVFLGEVDVISDPEAIKEDIGLMAQGLGHTLSPDLSIEENIDYFANIRNVPGEKRETIKETLLEATQLGKFRSRAARNLSGGMKQKLALCCTLIHSPRVLFLDEPTTGVDPVSRRDFYKILQNVISTSGVTIIVTTSYMEEAERCDFVALMHQGEIIGQGSPEELKVSISEELYLLNTDKADAAMALLKQNSQLADISQRGNKITVATVGNDSELFDLLKDHGFPQPIAIRPDMEYIFLRSIRNRSAEAESHEVSGLIAELGSGGMESAIDDDLIVSGENLEMKFGSFTAVNKVNFSIKKGEVFGFLGPNGAGKTTLIKMLCGLLKPSGGTGQVLGYSLGRDRSSLAQQIGYMSQKFSLYSDLRVRENIELFAGIYGLSARELKHKLPLALKLADLESREKTKTKDLPLGIKQRLALSCALLHGPRLLFLDEPTSGVDPLIRDRFWRIIFELSRQLGVTIIVTTHYMDEAERCDRLLLMLEGNIVATGTPSQLRSQVEEEKGKPLVINTSHPEKLVSFLQSRGTHCSRYGNDVILYSGDETAAASLVREIKGNFGSSSISPGEIPFEDIFIHFVEEGI